MALATRCPHCKTTFRVAHDQLKLRAGLVRCGACKEIFNGIEHLLRPDQTTPNTASSPMTVPPSAPPVPTPAPGDTSTVSAPVAPPQNRPIAPVPESVAEWAPDSKDDDTSAIAPQTTAKPAESGTPLPYVDFFDFLTPQKTPDPATSVSDVAAQEPVIDPDDPLQRMTLMDFREHDEDDDTNAYSASTSDSDSTSDSNSGNYKDSNRDDAGDTPIGDYVVEHAGAIQHGLQPDPLDDVIEDLQRKPYRRKRNIASPKSAKEEQLDTVDSNQDEEPGFVMSARRKQRFGRLFTALTAFGCLFLLAALLAQAVYTFRNQLGVRYPEAKPLLVNACAVIGCQVELPMQIDALSIESNELQAATSGQNTYTLSTLLRNRALVAQRWPHIELTLNDAQEKPVARRVFTPDEYLATPQQTETGFPPSSEHAVKLTFLLADLKPAGYRVYLFYP